MSCRPRHTHIHPLFSLPFLFFLVPNPFFIASRLKSQASISACTYTMPHPIGRHQSARLPRMVRSWPNIRAAIHASVLPVLLPTGATTPAQRSPDVVCPRTNVQSIASVGGCRQGGRRDVCCTATRHMYPGGARWAAHAHHCALTHDIACVTIRRARAQVTYTNVHAIPLPHFFYLAPPSPPHYSHCRNSAMNGLWKTIPKTGRHSKSWQHFTRTS